MENSTSKHVLEELESLENRSRCSRPWNPNSGQRVKWPRARWSCWCDDNFNATGKVLVGLDRPQDAAHRIGEVVIEHVLKLSVTQNWEQFGDEFQISGPCLPVRWTPSGIFDRGDG